MELVYYRRSVKNFGDDLNEILWNKLEPTLFTPKSDDAFLGIGTILGNKMDGSQRIHVFSSGGGNHSLENWSSREVFYHAVRGPITAKLLGLDASVGCSDGAILTPEILPASDIVEENTGIIIIPHWESLMYPGWDEVQELTGFTLVDPRQDPEIVIKKIANAKMVLTESLHGAILADTYGTPWISFVSNGNFDFGKWADWSLSVDVPYEVWGVPAPDATAVLRYGRPAAGKNAPLKISLEDGLTHMRQRIDHLKVYKHDFKISLKSRIKTIIKNSSYYRASLDLNPRRTADALIKLSKKPGYLSDERIRQSRYEELRSRLRKLALDYGG